MKRYLNPDSEYSPITHILLRTDGSFLKPQSSFPCSCAERRVAPERRSLPGEQNSCSDITIFQQKNTRQA